MPGKKVTTHEHRNQDIIQLSRFYTRSLERIINTIHLYGKKFMVRTRYKILEGDQSPYFISATTVNWLPLFSNPEIANFIFASLDFLQSNHRITIYAYVLMENHFHLVASSQDLTKELAAFKSYSARQSIDYYKAQGNTFILTQLAYYKLPHRTDRDYQFWQEGNHPKQIQDDTMMRQKIDYIHHNPVSRGYVDDPTHWRYSSARNYAGMTGILDVDMEW